jgi:hypothetical protein
MKVLRLRLQPLLERRALQRARPEQALVPLVLVLVRHVTQDLPRLCIHPYTHDEAATTTYQIFIYY